MNRRTYLAAAAAATGLGVAGCADSSSFDRGEGNGDDSPPAASDSATDLPDAAGTVDDFEDLEAWTVTGGALAADPDRAVVGSQSARLTVSADEGTTGLSKTFDEPRDLTDVVPGVAVAADDIVVPWLRLVDAAGNSVEYRRGVNGELPLMRYNFGVETADTGFDAAAVREVRLQLWTADGVTRTVWFDDLHYTPRPETGQVMIQFDDAHVTDYTRALPMLEEHGYPAVTFVNPSRIEAATDGIDDPHGFPRLDVDQVRELHDAGWTIGNHCYDHPHLSELDAAAQEKEIARGKSWLESEGFEDDAAYFAYPFGDYDATTIELVEEYHDIGFAGGRPVQGYTTNVGLASRIGEPSADRVRTELERTAAMNGITSVFFHRLEDEHLEAFETTVETIREYESTGELEVILPRDLEERFLF